MFLGARLTGRQDKGGSCFGVCGDMSTWTGSRGQWPEVGLDWKKAIAASGRDAKGKRGVGSVPLATGLKGGRPVQARNHGG